MNGTTLTALANLDLAITALETEVTTGTAGDSTAVDAAIQSRADSINQFVAAGGGVPISPVPNPGPVVAAAVSLAAARRALLPK